MLGCQDTTEDQAQREQELSDIAARFRVLESDNDHVCKCRSLHHEHPEEEEHQETTDMNLIGGHSVLVEANWVVPTKEDDDGHERVPGNFDKHIG